MQVRLSHLRSDLAECRLGLKQPPDTLSTRLRSYDLALNASYALVSQTRCDIPSGANPHWQGKRAPLIHTEVRYLLGEEGVKLEACKPFKHVHRLLEAFPINA